MNTHVHFPARTRWNGRALAACQEAQGKKRIAPKHWQFSTQLAELTCPQCRTLRQAAP